MKRITLMPIILALPATLNTLPAAATDASDHWRPYVCRVTEWADCEQNRNNKRIYPDQTLYPNKHSCLDGFGQRFENDPVIADAYPQTSDASDSYVFDCEQVR